MKKLMFIALILVIASISIIAQDGETPVPRDWSWVWQAITGLLVLLGGFFKSGMAKWKGKALQLAKFGSDSVDVLEAGTDLANTALDAAADNVFTAEEKAKIKTAAETWKDKKAQAVASWKVLTSKELPV